MLMAVVLIVLVIFTVLFNVWSPWWFTPIASNWGNIDDALIITFVICGIAFVAVSLFMAYCVFRFRNRGEGSATFEPENKKLEWWLAGVTTVGVVIMLAPGLSAWNDYITVPEDADTLEVVGQQWTWSFRLPGEDGEFGAVSTKRIYDTPFGLDPDDPKSLDDILVDDIEIHLPLGQPVRMNLRSVDVLHDFYVPQFRAKMDMVPGMVTYFWITPTRTGTFEILCAELCGIYHSDMRGTVVVEEEEDYRAWLAEQPTFAELLAEAGYDDQDRPTRLTSAGVDASAIALKDERNAPSDAARAAVTR